MIVLGSAPKVQLVFDTQRTVYSQLFEVAGHQQAGRCVTHCWLRLQSETKQNRIWSEPYLTFGVGRLLHLPSTEAVSVRPNVQPRCNQKVTVIGCEAETSAVKPNKSPAGTGDV